MWGDNIFLAVSTRTHWKSWTHAPSTFLPSFLYLPLFFFIVISFVIYIYLFFFFFTEKLFSFLLDKFILCVCRWFPSGVGADVNKPPYKKSLTRFYFYFYVALFNSFFFNVKKTFPLLLFEISFQLIFLFFLRCFSVPLFIWSNRPLDRPQFF